MNDGGPAFPVPPMHQDASGDAYFATDGMTLRDYFAGQALIGMAGDSGQPAALKAKWAYAIADAMLQERAGSRV